MSAFVQYLISPNRGVDVENRRSSVSVVGLRISARSDERACLRLVLYPGIFLRYFRSPIQSDRRIGGYQFEIRVPRGVNGLRVLQPALIHVIYVLAVVRIQEGIAAMLSARDTSQDRPDRPPAALEASP